jgi:histidinol-phosphate aminotransferase
MLPAAELLADLADASVELVRSYPDVTPLARKLAQRFGASPNQVLVTAGVDDALDRACRALVGPGAPLVLPVPTFEMIGRYAVLAGAEVKRVPWDSGAWPIDDVLAVAAGAGAVAVVSPNNPTGAVVSAAQLRRLSAALPDTAILLDHAYVEFADEDLTRVGLSLPNVLVFRTLSKAWGLAGLRTGCVMGPPDALLALKSAGLPYPCSGPSLRLAETWLDLGADAMTSFVKEVRRQRADLTSRAPAWGLQPRPSQGNFVLFDVKEPLWVRDAMAGFGISIRAFPGKERLETAIRITTPGFPEPFNRLAAALHTMASPQAIIFDMDGVLVEVGASYRTAIIETAASYGVGVTRTDIQRAKDAGDANNDWRLTWQLVTKAGVDTTLDEVTRRFEVLYQGAGDVPGLWTKETPMATRDWLVQLAQRFKLAVVTGRPRRDAKRFLRTEGIDDLFDSVVCMEDAPAKPDPAPVELALAQLGVQRAWMLGDTRDDLVAARLAGVLPIGVNTDKEQHDTLRSAGAARVFLRPQGIEELLP